MASGLNFFFRAEMDAEAKIRVGLEVSRQFYTLAHDAKLDAEMVTKAAPLLAAIMTSELERVRFESINHTKVYDSLRARTHPELRRDRVTHPSPGVLSLPGPDEQRGQSESAKVVT